MGGTFVSVSHEVNAWSALFVGLTLNSLLIYLIRNRTIKEMRVYSRILLQTCVTDSILLVATAVVQPVYVAGDGHSYGINNGLVRMAPSGVRAVAYALWALVFYFSLHSMSVQFIYRYLVLCKRRVISAIFYFSLLLCVLVVDSVLCMLLLDAGYPQSRVDDQITSQSVLWPILSDGTSDYYPVALIMTGGSFSWNAFLLSCVFFNALAYTIMAVSALRIRRYILQMYGVEAKQNARQRETNVQITRTLLYQASFPVMVMGISTATALYGLLSTKPDESATYLAMGTIPCFWIPVGNPLVSIFTIRSYRRFFTHRNKTKASSTDHSPVNVAVHGARQTNCIGGTASTPSPP